MRSMKGTIACGLMIGIAAAVLGSMTVGCSSYHTSGFSDPGRLQLQFFKPPGSVLNVEGAVSEIDPEAPHAPKLQDSEGPETAATYNFKPGLYQFVYSEIPGWEDLSVYGEVEVYHTDSGNPLLRNCFIPIALPAPSTAENQPVGDTVFPYQSASDRLKVDFMDVERLVNGDVISKVIFVADLSKVKKEVRQLRTGLVVKERELERLDRLYREARLIWIQEPESRKFIEYEAQRQDLRQTIDDMDDRLRRLERLLRVDNVLIRREMMVLASEEFLDSHEDPITSASEIGQVVMVLRVGARHQRWDIAGSGFKLFR